MQEFRIEFVRSLKVAVGGDGCNVFYLKLEDELAPQTLNIRTGEITLLGCAEIGFQFNSPDVIEPQRVFSGLLVLPYLNHYALAGDKLIFTSKEGDRRFIFHLIGPTSESALDNLPKSFVNQLKP